MEPEGFNRKLSAILSADVKGYSLLMRSDEEATVRTLNKYRAIIAELVEKYQGRVVDSPGDNILAEFASVVHSVQCGFDIQASLQDENASLSEDRRMEVYFGTTKSPQKTLEDAVKLYQKTLAIDESHPIATGGLAYVYGMQRKYEEAVIQAQRSINLNPGRANPALGIALLNLGKYDESVQSLKKVIRLDPKGPAFYFHFLGHAYFGLEMYEKAIASYKKALDRKPDFLFAHAFLAAAYYMAGQVDNARMEAVEVRRIDPKFAVGEFAKSLHFKDKEFQNRVIESMWKAGLPD